MRSHATPNSIRRLLRELGRRARGPGRVYLTGGASALLIGWRTSTVDIDLRLDPEPAGIFEAIRDLKDELGLNIELASPQDFMPELPGWRRRSVFIERHGEVDFYHYDFCAQALSKLQRGHDRDVSDVEAMVDHGLVDVGQLETLYEGIEPDLIRFPSIDAERFREQVERFATSRGSRAAEEES